MWGVGTVNHETISDPLTHFAMFDLSSDPLWARILANAGKPGPELSEPGPEPVGQGQAAARQFGEAETLGVRETTTEDHGPLPPPAELGVGPPPEVLPPGGDDNGDVEAGAPPNPEEDPAGSGTAMSTLGKGKQGQDGHDIFSSHFLKSTLAVGLSALATRQAVQPAPARQTECRQEQGASRPGTTGGGSRPGTRQKLGSRGDSRGNSRGPSADSSSKTTATIMTTTPTPRPEGDDERAKVGVGERKASVQGKGAMPQPKTMSANAIRQIEKQKLHRHRVSSARHVTSSWIGENTVKKWERMRNKHAHKLQNPDYDGMSLSLKLHNNVINLDAFVRNDARHKSLLSKVSAFTNNKVRWRGARSGALLKRARR